MTESVLLHDHPAPGVLRLRINRPDKRNAMDQAVRQAFIDALKDFHADPAARALVIGGVGGVLSAGGDVASMAGLDEASARARMRHGHQLCALLAAVDRPVVMALEGFSAGAVVGLAMLCDHLVAGPGTQVLFPFLKLGLTPDWGQLLTLPRRVGLPAARRILQAGKPVRGDEALRIGLVDELVPDAEVMDVAVRQASVLAAMPQQAFARMKRRLMQPSASLEEELAREETDQALCLSGPEFAEGLAAFQQKRTPDFLGLADKA